MKISKTLGINLKKTFSPPFDGEVIFQKKIDFVIFIASTKILESFQNGDRVPNCTQNKTMGHNDAARLWFGSLISIRGSENCIWNYFNVIFQINTKVSAKNMKPMLLMRSWEFNVENPVNRIIFFSEGVHIGMLILVFSTHVRSCHHLAFRRCYWGSPVKHSVNARLYTYSSCLETSKNLYVA